MAEQMGTPGSTADTSVNGSKLPAAKDKSCPFCQQPFTSSSLGRHLDLYIKERNPKAADGIHDVDEIRKMRGGITRRQPRNSAARRDVSTPVGTPGEGGRSPRDSAERRKRSPSLRKGNSVQDLGSYCEKPLYSVNKPSWESTGVINHIPPAKRDDSLRGWDPEAKDGSGRKMESRNRSVSRHVLAKTTFEQKEKMMEALDNARAAELALREFLGALRAAKQRIDGGCIFEYDPLTLDFPTLVLRCLPPPPTLQQTNPFPNSSSWSILPPDEQRYQALRAHFSEEFHRWRVACTVATTAPNDDLSYPPPPFAGHEEPAEVARRAEEDSRELETKISEHLQNAFTRWNSLPTQSRSELWTLALARDIGAKSEEIGKLKKEREYSQQEISHLKIQVDELSRLQHPREFRLSRPETIPFDSQFMTALSEKRSVERASVGWSTLDRNVHIDAVVERAIGRWKNVVKEARNGRPPSSGKLSGQFSFNRAPISAQSPAQQKSASVDQPASRNSTNRASVQMTDGPESASTDPDADADADADADMEEDDSFVEMSDASLAPGQRGPEAAMAQAANFTLANGYGGSTAHQQQQGANGQRGSVLEGLENQTCVGGYVRIGA